MRVTVEQLVEWRLAGETEVLGENLPQHHFVINTHSTMTLTLVMRNCNCTETFFHKTEMRHGLWNSSIDNFKLFSKFFVLNAKAQEGLDFCQKLKNYSTIPTSPITLNIGMWLRKEAHFSI
jgi:hypothetical protein